MLQEFYVNATPTLKASLPLEAAKRIVASLMRWEVHALADEDVLRVIELQEGHRLSFWDAMAVMIGGRLGCGCSSRKT